MTSASSGGMGGSSAHSQDGGAFQEVMVTVGTDHHPFSRVVDWAEQYALDRQSSKIRVSYQWGTSRPPLTGRGAAYLPIAELEQTMRSATVVVCHGGPGTIMAARSCGSKPIVVPRDPSLGEHVDRHQQRFARFMADKDQIHLADSKAEFYKIMDLCLADPALAALDGKATSDTLVAAMRFGAAAENLTNKRLSNGWRNAKAPSPSASLRILIPTSGGGHLTQCYALQPWLNSHDVLWVSGDAVDVNSVLEGERLVEAHFPTTRNLVNLAKNFFLCVKLMRSFQPDLIVSTGAGVAVPFFWVARLFGAVSIYIEVYDRIDSATLTGRLVGPWADEFYVQWKDQLEVYPKAKLLGRLL